MMIQKQKLNIFSEEFLFQKNLLYLHSHSHDIIFPSLSSFFPFIHSDNSFGYQLLIIFNISIFEFVNIMMITGNILDHIFFER